MNSYLPLPGTYTLNKGVNSIIRGKTIKKNLHCQYGIVYKGMGVDILVLCFNTRVTSQAVGNLLWEGIDQVFTS